MNLILREQTGNQEAKITTAFVPMKTESFTRDPFLIATVDFMPLLFILSYIAPVFRIIALVVAEKESKAREGMKMMGLKDSAYWLSWHAQYLVIHLIIALGAAGVASKWVFTYSSYGLCFLLFFLYGFAVYAFALFICAFFYVSKLASIIGCMAYFASYILGELVRRNEVVEAVRIILSIFPPIDISFLSNNFVKLDAGQIGVTMDSVNTIVDDYKISTGFAMLAADIFIYFILALYVENIVPNLGGVSKPWYFFVQSSYWFGTPSHESSGRVTPAESEAENDEQEGFGVKTYEQISGTLKAKIASGDCLRVHGLRKTYPNGTKAVQGISLNMFSGQIFALLGHNGAGKTSTIQILTGAEEPTKGTARAFGFEIFQNMGQLRTMLGVCPQHDVLFEQLTPREHLEIFATFKGMSDREKIDSDISNLLEELLLKGAEAQEAAYLSGGEKRKLSIAIAFIGDSKIILLDEPTSGMDMSSRRTVWRTLRKNKQDKIVILTTHYMDEADYLGDRIAIMAKGKIMCLGSSFFLKNKIGDGYNIQITKKEGAVTKDICDLISKHIKEFTILTDTQQDTILQLPKSAESSFKELFIDLDKNINDLKIESYGVSVTTLEEVFLQVGKGEHEEEKDIENKHAKYHDDNVLSPKPNESPDSPLSSVNDEYTIADPRNREAGGCNIFWLHMYAVLMKRLICLKRGMLQFIVEIIVPLLLVLFGLSLTKINFYYDSKPRVFDVSLFPTPQKLMINADISQYNSNISEYTNFLRSGLIPNPISLTNPPDYSQSLREMEAKIVKFPERMYGSVLFSTLNKSTQTYTFTIFANLFSQESSAAYNNLIGESVLKYATNNPNLKVNIYTAPLPLRYNTKILEKKSNANGVGNSMTLSFALIPASLIIFLVRERQDRLKHQQVISGVSLIAYWIANSLIELIKSCTPVCISIGMIYAFGVDLPYAWAMMIGYMFTIVPFTYATTFFFNNESTAQVGTLIIHVFCGAILGPVMQVFFIFENTRQLSKVLTWILRIVPSFCLSAGIRLASTVESNALVEGKMKPDPPLDIKNAAGGDLLFLGIDFAVFVAAIIVIESRIYVPIWNCITCTKDYSATAAECAPSPYPEIAAHNQLIHRSKPENYSLYAANLFKTFSVSSTEKIEAVRGISLGMKAGECFALLGTTGAGKSTAFRLLTLDENPTSGVVYIKGKELSANFTEVRQLIGYCPQTESHFPTLTVYENLQYYAMLKGILSTKKDAIIENLLEIMDLNSYHDILAGQLSGGNKRKLSVAIALLGNPPIIVLDEPSTGVDPQAKRFMWKIISRITKERKNSTVIFTTHSMEEAENLCTVMGIMLRGRFRCIGAPQKIKDNYGKGYEIEIKVKTPTDHDIAGFLAQYGFSEKDTFGEKELFELMDKIDLSDIKLQVSNTGFACDFYEDVFF